MMDMQFGLLARQKHYERIKNALGPRPEPGGPIVPPETRRASAPWSRIARVTHWPAFLIPRLTASRRA